LPFAATWSGTRRPTQFVTATKWTTAANAIFLQYSGVVWVLIFSPLLLREPFRRRDAAAIVVALGGMALFFVGKFHAGGAGDAMAILSGIFFAALVLALRRERDAGAEAAVTYGNVLACASDHQALASLRTLQIGSFHLRKVKSLDNAGNVIGVLLVQDRHRHVGQAGHRSRRGKHLRDAL